VHSQHHIQAYLTKKSLMNILIIQNHNNISIKLELTDKIIQPKNCSNPQLRALPIATKGRN